MYVSVGVYALNQNVFSTLYTLVRIVITSDWKVISGTCFLLGFIARIAG